MNPSNWQSMGQNLAAKGSEAYDECIDLVCRNCDRPFRSAQLEAWGIANGALQIEAWALFSNLSPDSPLLRLSNSQRLALFSQGANWSDQLAEVAREHLEAGGTPSRITDNWAAVMVKGMKATITGLRTDANIRAGHRTMGERLAIIEAERQKALAEVEKLKALVEALANENEALRAGRPLGLQVAA